MPKVNKLKKMRQSFSHLFQYMKPSLMFGNRVIAVFELLLFLAVIAVQFVVLPFQGPQLHEFLLREILVQLSHGPK